MGKTIDIEIQKQIPILYSQLKSKKKVAEKLGISVATVSKYLNLLEAGESSEKKPRTKITTELIKQINNLYTNCGNMTQVAKELGISVPAVKNHLSEENLKLKDKLNEDRDALFFYIIRLFGIYSEDSPVSEWNLVQMAKFKRQGYPYKGQHLALKYFFEIKKSPIEKAKGSIGIVPYIFDQAKLYYEKEAKRREEIDEALQRQLAQDRISIPYNPSDYFGKKKKKTIDLNSIQEES